MTVNNSVHIIGNLTRDAEVRRTQSGVPVANIYVAVTNKKRDPQTGEWGNEPCFIDCTLFGRRAEALEQYLVKGKEVAIDGHLVYSQWEAKDGSGKRTKLELYVEDIKLLGGRDNANQGQKQYSQPSLSPYEDDDIPF